MKMDIEMLDLACREYNYNQFVDTELVISYNKIKESVASNLIEIYYIYRYETLDKPSVPVVLYLPLDFYTEFIRDIKINKILE